MVTILLRLYSVRINSLLLGVVLSLHLSSATAITITLQEITSGLTFPASGIVAGSPAPTAQGGGNLNSIMRAAKLYWESAIRDSHTVTIQYGWADGSQIGGASAATTPISIDSAGRTTLAEIVFSNTGPNPMGGVGQWFLDPIPSNSEEYLSIDTFSQPAVGGSITYGRELSLPQMEAVARRDALSTAMHEIGHVISSVTAPQVTVTAPRPFAGTTIPVTPAGGGHLDISHALLAVGRPDGIRQYPSMADVLAIAEGGKYENIQLGAILTAGDVGCGGVNTPGNASTSINCFGLGLTPSGRGALSITGGSVLKTLGGAIALAAGSRADVEVSGEGSQWLINADGAFICPGCSGPQGFSLGGLGNGTLSVTDGGFVKGQGTSIGLGGGSGHLIVDGSNSRIELTGFGVGDSGGDGTITLKNGGVVSAPSIQVGPNGRVEGNGTLGVPLIGRTTLAGGYIAPGLSTGTLLIDGDFFFNDGILEIEVGGLGAAEFDVLQVTGDASFTGGTILFSFINDFLPQTGDIIDFLTADNLSNFSNVAMDFMGLADGFQFHVNTMPGVDGGLQFLALNDGQSVPEPGTALLLLVAISALLGVRAHRV